MNLIDAFERKQPRRAFLKTAGVGAVAVSFPSWIRCVSEPQHRPNILFIMTDDHGYQAISCYGSQINTTPQIDRLAIEGVRFENSFCTNSICAPSRAVLLTGRYSHINGVVDNSVTFDGRQQTFTQLLQEAGYETALFGKWRRREGLERGVWTEERSLWEGATERECACQMEISAVHQRLPAMYCLR